MDDSPEVEGVEVEAIEAAIEEALTETLTLIQTLPEVAAEAAPETMVGPDSIKVPGHLICPQESGGGARCTIAGGSLHFSVLSPIHALGRTSSPRSLQEIERMASSVTIK